MSLALGGHVDLFVMVEVTAAWLVGGCQLADLSPSQTRGSMRPWTPVGSDARIILHLSDLHFGLANQDEVFQTLLTFLRKNLQSDVVAVLITGDIVDSPDEAIADQARKNLVSLCDAVRHSHDVELLTVAGNHDVYRLGNYVPWLWPRPKRTKTFEATFQSHLATSKPRLVTAGDWRIGVIGANTAEFADYFARGYLPATALEDIKAAANIPDVDLAIVPDPKNAQRWAIAWRTPPDAKDATVDIVLSYQWLAGALLTKREFADAGDRARELVRGEGREYATLRVPDVVGRAQIALIVPRALAPAEIEVKVFDAEEKVVSGASRDARTQLTTFAPGHYVLDVKYPRVGWRYTLAWEPASWKGASPADLAPFADARAFLSYVRARLPDSPDRASWKMALYLRTVEGLRLVAEDGRPGLQKNEPVVGDRSFVAQACWGVPIMVERGAAGMMPDEAVAWSLPLVTSLDGADEPLGVLRISYPTEIPGLSRSFHLQLAEATIAALIRRQAVLD